MTLKQSRSWMFCTLFVCMAVLKLCNGQANTCDDNLPDIENAKPTGNNTPPFTVNTLIRYYCNPGFQMSQGGVFAKCVLEDNSATWVLSESRCTLKSCSHPGNIDNGRKIGDDFRFGKNVTYKCNAGYDIVGRATIFCGANSEWTDTPPRCKIISCDRPPKLANGSVSYNNLTYRSKATYTCDNSFHFVGISDTTVTRQCLANRTWSGSIPQCEEVQCPDLPRGPGITITDTSSDQTKHPVGKVIYFKCDNEQPELSRCLPDGKWSIFPNCGEEVFCPVPPLPPGIIIVHLHSQGQEKYKVNDVISYLCQSSGNRTFARCNSDGTWSTLPGHCEEVTTAGPTIAPPPKSSTEAGGIRTPCGEAPQIQHGTVTLESQNAQYECNSGFSLRGSAVLKCLSSGRWDSMPPSCEKKFPVGLVIGIVVGAIIVIAGGIAGGVLLYKKKKSATPSKKKASPSDAVTIDEIQKLEKNSKPVPVTVL